MAHRTSRERGTRGDDGRQGAGGAYGSVLLGPAEQSPRQLRVRIQTLLTVLLVATNLIGAGIVFVLSTLVIPSPPLDDGSVLALAIGVPVYVGRRDLRRHRVGYGGRAARAALGDRGPDSQRGGAAQARSASPGS